jgi:hypothetical protein
MNHPLSARDAVILWLIHSRVKGAKYKRKPSAPFGRMLLRNRKRLAGKEAIQMPTVIRCPYCVIGTQFREMLQDTCGIFYCKKCGHVAKPADSEFKCCCSKCLAGRFSTGATRLHPSL